MRRAVAMVGVMALFVASGVALAATVRCDGGECLGTPRADTLRGSDRRDVMYGRDGGDTLRGAGGTDEMYGGSGNDLLYSDDGNADYVSCGYDQADIDTFDLVSRDCDVTY